MKLKQLSIFLENRPGGLSEPCRILAEAGINILTLSLADTQQFGILRLILHDWEKARDVLARAGNTVKVTDVVAVAVPDRPGGLACVLEILEEARLNIEYMYAFTFRSQDEAELVFRFKDPDAAVRVLTEKGLKVIGLEEICRRAR